MHDDDHTTDWAGSVGDSATSSSLMERVKAHEAQAWERLVDLYAPLIYQWCRQCGLQAADAADVGQEAFAAVAAHVASFRRERPGDSFRGWLWTITRNKIRDHARSRDPASVQGRSQAWERLAQLPDREPEPTSASRSGIANHQVQRRAVEIVRAGVEERTWLAFWRVAVEGQEPADVAQSLGVTVQAVYGSIYRVRRKIRQELDGLFD